MSMSVTPLRYLRIPSVNGEKIVIHKTRSYKTNCERFVISGYDSGWQVSSPLAAKYGAQWRAWLNRVGLYGNSFTTRREALESLIMALEFDNMVDVAKP